MGECLDHDHGQTNSDVFHQTVDTFLSHSPDQAHQSPPHKAAELLADLVYDANSSVVKNIRLKLLLMFGRLEAE